TLKDELKKVDMKLNICIEPDIIIKTRTLEEENEVLKVVKNETCGCEERLALVTEKRNAL
ncbi:hypothetical protein KI387_017331, partial [Taxus chinensis]